MTRTSRDRLLDSIADTDPSGPTNPFQAGGHPDAESGVHGDMLKLRTPDAWVGAVDEDEGPTLLPLDLNED